MIKVTNVVIEKYHPKQVKVSLIADTKAEVIAIKNDGSSVVGLQAGDIMTFGSTCLCVNGDFGILKSDGTWQF